MSTITRMRERHSHPATTARKVAEVTEVADRYQALRRETVHRYWRAEYLPVVLHKKAAMSIVTARRHNGEAAAFPLGSHLQANAVTDGLDLIRGSWNQAFAAVRSAAARKFRDTTQEVTDERGRTRIEKISNPARHEINWLLRWPDHIVTILAGGTVVPTDETGEPRFTNNDHEKLDRWLAAAIRHHRPGQPSLKHKPAFEIDDYRVSARPGRFPVWLVIAGLTRGKPIRIPMAGTDSEHLDGTSNLQVAVETDSRGVRRIVFRRAVEIEVIERTGTGAVGLDKGANIAIAATASDPEHAVFLGSDAGTILGRRSERSFRKGRSRLASRADNLAGRHAPSGRFHGNPTPTAAQKRTARHIRRCNLGTTRRDAEQRRCEAELRNVTGRASRALVEAFPDAVVFYEEKLDFRGADTRRPRRTNRKINRWMKKELSESIERHVSASGARREFVAAAYTSQACPPLLLDPSAAARWDRWLVEPLAQRGQIERRSR